MRLVVESSAMWRAFVRPSGTRFLCWSSSQSFTLGYSRISLRETGAEAHVVSKRVDPVA